MSYSRTYRHSNGVGPYRTNWNGGQNQQNGRQTATGNHAEQAQQAETAKTEIERQVNSKARSQTSKDSSLQSSPLNCNDGDLDLFLLTHSF